MSMNLNCKEVELWQTPTDITYMCYSNNDGGWKGILYRYIQWIKYRHLSKTFDSKEDYEDTLDIINKHIEELQSKKKLNFYIM